MTGSSPGFFVPGSGWLYRLDPRVKLWFSLLAVLLCILTPNLGILAGLLLGTQIILLAGGLSPRRVGRVWRSLAPLVLIILILQPLLSPGGDAPLAQFGPLRITLAGLITGLRYGLRVTAAAFAVLVPALTTPTNQLVRALNKIGLPYAWAMTIGLALRYLGAIGELYTTISEAQQARGWDLSKGGLVKRVKNATPTLIALIVASLRLSDSLALGLAARGFGLTNGQHAGTRKRTCLHDITLRRADWAVLAVTTLLFGAVLLLA